MRLLCSKCKTSSRLASSPTVTSLSLPVMIEDTGLSKCFSKRRSRLVTIPTRSSPSTTGTPEILCARVSSTTAPMEVFGLTVMGSRTTPLSNFFTLRTSSACCSMVIFLCRIPRPPSWAMAIARRLSVTVSIAADSNGILMVISRVNCVVRLTSRGRTFE